MIKESTNIVLKEITVSYLNIIGTPLLFFNEIQS